MIIPRNLYSDSAPDRRSRLANNPTLLYSWWCTVFSAVIIGIRLSGRYIRNERLFREDKIMALSIIPLFARMGFVHVVLIYGTNNVDVSNLTDPVIIRHREIGSQMVLGSRIFYALFIWMAKFTVSEFLKRLTERFWKKGYEWGLRGIRIFLVVTFCMVLIATLAECQPTTHYWQVVPDPGPQCRQGYAQLLTMGITDIVTDVFLIAFPIPIIVRSSMPLKRKMSLITLFSLSVVLIIVTGARMPLVIERKGLQQFRTVFASSEILAAATVSNAIILGSFLRDRGVKKAKFKAPSTTDSMERRESARRFTDQSRSSDEDLARSLGYRTKPELLEKCSTVPRPAPVADLDLLSSTRQPGPFVNNNWKFPDEEASMIQGDDSSTPMMEDIRDPMPSPRCGRRVSWFDVGGLLETPGVAPSPTDSVIAHDFATQPRRGSRASNSIMSSGRAFLPQARRNSRLSQHSEDYEMSTRPTHQLQDLGGLLSEDREQEEAQSTASRYPGSPVAPPSRHERTASMQRTSTRSTQASYDVPSLRDPGARTMSNRSSSFNSLLHNPSETPTSLQLCGVSEMSNDAPTLEEIVRLTRQELTTTQKTDPIRECGRAALSLLPNDPELGLKLAYQKLHDVPYRDVKTCWRRLYTDASLWKVLGLVRGGHDDESAGPSSQGRVEGRWACATEGDWVNETVRLLDMALILAGAPWREELVELWFAALKAALTSALQPDIASPERPAKRQKLSPSHPSLPIPASFPAELREPAPNLRHPVPRAKEPSLEAFQKKVGCTETHTPCIMEDAIQHWPALEERPWNSPEYLLEQTLGGRRLIPVEVGKSYTDESWGQRITTFRDFMETYMLNQENDSASQASPNKSLQPTGYLAQHDLFAQIPSLRADISIPDYCYCEPAASPHLTHIKPVAKLEEPLLNAWFGPAGTISPLHTDPYHNILAQVVGYKYVRLYAPRETERLYPRSVDDSGVDMSNTSRVDLDEAMAVYPDISCFAVTGEDGPAPSHGREEVRREFETHFPAFGNAPYIDAILGPGECLYLPVGWWHYIRSLTPSFSVSFWFN
ncbi:hypothetical protein TW65_03413 [Stemphylium lycopersici]|nr:hypothetical protein TW65_03413 [Stemphylium lycopersici]